MQVGSYLEKPKILFLLKSWCKIFSYWITGLFFKYKGLSFSMNDIQFTSYSKESSDKYFNWFPVYNLSSVFIVVNLKIRHIFTC